MGLQEWGGAPRLLYGRTKERQDLFGRAGHFRILPGDASPSLEMKAHALRVLNSHFFPTPSFTQASPQVEPGLAGRRGQRSIKTIPLGNPSKAPPLGTRGRPARGVRSLGEARRLRVTGLRSSGDTLGCSPHPNSRPEPTLLGAQSPSPPPSRAGASHTCTCRAPGPASSPRARGASGESVGEPGVSLSPKTRLPGALQHPEHFGPQTRGNLAHTNPPSRAPPVASACRRLRVDGVGPTRWLRAPFRGARPCNWWIFLNRFGGRGERGVGAGSGAISSGSPIRSLLRRCLRPVPATADHEAAGTQIRAADRYLPASGSELEGLRGPQEGRTRGADASCPGGVLGRCSQPWLCTPSPRGRTPGARSDSASKLDSSELSPPARARARAARFPQNPNLLASLAEKFLALAPSGD